MGGGQVMGSGSRIDRATGRKVREAGKLRGGRAGAIKREGGKKTEKRVDQKKRTVTGKTQIKAKNAASAEREKGWRRLASQQAQRKNAAQN